MGIKEWQCPSGNTITISDTEKAGFVAAEVCLTVCQLGYCLLGDNSQAFIAACIEHSIDLSKPDADNSQ